MDDLDTEFQEAEDDLETSAKALDERRSIQEGDDRSFIAKLIIVAFLIMVGLVIIAAMIGTYLLGWENLVEPGKFLVAILGSVMLPVVTLVIGYYFGTK